MNDRSVKNTMILLLMATRVTKAAKVGWNRYEIIPIEVTFLITHHR